MLQELWSMVFIPVLISAVTGIFGWIGVQIKKAIEKTADEKLKKELAETCVRGVEQVYDYLHGAEKYAKCVDNLTEMCAEKGIMITELEIKMLIEAAVQRMNAEIIKIDADPLQECTACDIVYKDGEEV